MADEILGGSPGRPSNLASLPLTRLMLGGILLQFLRAHFSDPDQITQDAARGRVWRPDDSSAIMIAMVDQWLPTTAMMRPAILVSPDAWHPLPSKGVGDAQTQGELDPGVRTYTRLVLGSHTIFAIAEEPAEAEVIAQEVYDELLCFCPVLREDIPGLDRFSVSELGKPFEIEESTENYAVPVTVSYVTQRTWHVRPEIPWLKVLDLEFHPRTEAH